MDKDYFYKLWVISLLGYTFIFQFMSEHAESGIYERLFRAYNILNLALLIAAICILISKWKYMLPVHRILSITGQVINIGLVALILSTWYLSWQESGRIFQY